MTVVVIHGSVVVLDNKEVEDAMALKCECGHSLKCHGFVSNINYPVLGQTTLYVSQCVFCPIVDGEFTCRRFKAAQ